MLDTVTGPELLDEVHGALQHFWTEHQNVPASIRMTVATGVAEIAANILQHAGARRSVPVRMNVEAFPHRVRVVFTDEGEPAAVDLAAVGTTDPLAQSGRGLALASAVLDGLYYDRHGDRNTWTLVSQRFD